MFKKVLFISMIMAGSHIAIAGTPYIGGSLGVTNLSILSGGKVQAGSVAKLFGGYGTTFGVNNHFYSGVELNLDLAYYPSYSGTDYGLGTSFIPGIMLTKDTMLFGRIGIAADRNVHSAVTNIGNQLGFGLQTDVTKHWAIRGEYVRLSNINGNVSGHSQLNLGLVYKFD